MKKKPKKIRKFIPVEEAFARWEKNPAFRKAYAALEDEFAFVREVLRVRAAAGLTQKQLARRMDTTQGTIARLESGTTMPSTRTLQKLAAATGHKLKITFEPLCAD